MWNFEVEGQKSYFCIFIDKYDYNNYGMDLVCYNHVLHF